MENCISKLKHFFSEMELPGIKSQDKMAPSLRSASLKLHENQEEAIPSSVLILFFPENGTLKTVLILRPVYNGIHSGQIGFPGGKSEETDVSYIHTALREAQEEIGIEEDVEILGTLTDLFIPPSNYLVKPVMAYTSRKPDFKIDDFEVEELIIIDLKDLINPTNMHQNESFDVGKGESVKAPCYIIQEKYRIWGATAMIISELIEIMKSIECNENNLD